MKTENESRNSEKRNSFSRSKNARNSSLLLFITTIHGSHRDYFGISKENIRASRDYLMRNIPYGK